MTAPGGSWASAHVDVDLDWDGLDDEMVRRLERSAQVAQRAVNRNLDKIAGGARRSFEKVADAYDRQMDRIERRTTRTVASINRRLRQIEDVNARINIEMTGASATDIRATASALRRIQRDAGNVAVRIQVSIHSMREVRELAETLRRLPRSRTVNVNVDQRGTAARAVRNLTSLGGVLGGVGSVVGSFGRTALGVVGTLGKFTAIAGAATVAVGGMMPAIAALSSGLVAVGGAAGTVAAGGFFALIAAGGALVTAFSGIGEAAKNMFDPEKAEEFEKALAELAPSAQSAMRAVQKLGKTYGDVVKDAVQQRFFQGLDKEIAGLQKFMVPLRNSLVQVAAGFNDGANRALNFINTARGTSMVNTLLAESGSLASNLGNFLTRLVPGFLSIGTAASQALAPLSRGIGDIAGRWSQTMLQMQQDGTLQEKMEGWLEVAKQVGHALSTVGSIFGGVFKAAKAAGDGNPLGGLQQTLTTVSEWVNGPGQQALIGFFTSMQQAMGTVLPILGQVAGIIGGQVAPMIAGLITQIGPALSELVSGIGLGIAALQPAIAPLGNALSAIGTALAPVMPILGQLIASFVQLAGPILAQLVTALAPVVEAIGQGLTAALSALQPAIAPVSRVFQILSPILAQIAGVLADVLVGAIQAIIPAVETFAQGFAQVMDALSPLIPILGDALMQIISALAPMIGTMADAWLRIVEAIVPLIPLFVQIVEALLPPMLELLTSLMPLLTIGAQLFAALVPVLIPIVSIIMRLVLVWAQLLGTIISFVAKVIGLVMSFVTTVITLFGQLVSTVVETVSGWVSNVIGFFSDLASRAIAWVKDLWDSVTSGFSKGVDTAVNFVKELPGKILDGLKGAGRWLVDTGKNIIQGLIDGIKSMGKAIVNALINLLPGPLRGAARSALGLALGGWIPGLAQGGVAAMLGGGTPTGATTPIRPGGFIVNARQTRKNRGLLRALAPTGRVLSGPGTETSDSITGTHNGHPVARVSRGEYYVPPQTARRMLPQLMAINAGRLQALASGGRIPYGMPVGTNISYGAPGFPEWVYELGKQYNVKPSTYAGHQESSGKNKGIDWSGSVPDMQKFAEHLLSIAPDMEQVIWMNPDTGEQIGVADGKRVGPGTDQPGYYRDDWAGHQDHVHTRASYAFGGASSASAKGIDDTTGSLGTSTSSGSGGTPIGSGIGTSAGTGSGSGASWGNSGGESRANNAVDAKRAGLTPVWVENWPASIGGGGSGGLDTGTTTTGGDLSTGTTTGGAVGEPQKVTASSSKKDVAAAIYAHARKRGYSHEEALAIVSTAIQESNLDANASGGGGAWHGYFQQDSSYANRDDPNGNITGFLDRLDEKTKADPNSDIWKRIFWLQQRPGETSAEAAYGNGRQAYLDEIKSRQGEAKELVGKVPVTSDGTVPVTVTNTDTDTATTGGDLSTGQTTTTTTTPDTTASGQQPRSASMPYGKARADQWLSEQNLGASLQDVGVAGLKETFGEFGALIGVESFVERGIDEMVAYLRQIAEKDPKAEFKWADVVNINGGNPEQTKQKTTEGMTAVMDTYRQG